MSLESLANELLLDLLEYLDAINLLRAFHGLNHRFNQLLSVKLQRYYLDFRSLSKCDFDSFCRHHLATINDRVISFHLSNDVETPNLIELFFANGYHVNQFTHLKSLSIDYTDSFDLLDQITCQCREFSYLTHLSITLNNRGDPEEYFRNFINNIWSLSKLSHCYLDITFPYTGWLLKMSTISQSIHYLLTKNIYYDSNSLSHLFKHTPHLQRSSVGKIGEFKDQQIQPIFPSLISLNATIESSILWMKNLFQKLPHLCYLTLQVKNLSLNGHEWEKILSNHLKNINVFRLQMTVEFSASEDLEEQVDQLLDSFRNDYWIEKRQWFVQCDWCPMDVNRNGLLYTLPYAFDIFYYMNGTRSKSTSVHESDDSVYNRVQTLYHTGRKRHLDRIETSSLIRFINIRHLTIRCPFEDDFLLVIPTLNRLISLDATLTQNFGYSQLQLLLDRAPRLRTLRFCHLNKFSIDSFSINSTSIRRLEFFQNFSYDLQYFNTTECIKLARSAIASQCQVLMIDVESQTNILELIQIMPNLRVLNVRCKTDRKYGHELTETINNFVKWLHDHSLSKFTYSMVRYLYPALSVNIWIY